MKSILIFALLAVCLTGCEKKTVEKSDAYVLPDGLKDCKIYSMKGDGYAERLYVVRCPNSQTATHWTTHRYDPATKAVRYTHHNATVVEAGA